MHILQDTFTNRADTHTLLHLKQHSSLLLWKHWSQCLIFLFGNLTDSVKLLCAARTKISLVCGLPVVCTFTSCSSVMFNYNLIMLMRWTLFPVAVFGRSAGGGNLRNSDAQQRQQRSQKDHRQADGSLCLPERSDRRDNQGEASMCRWWVQWPL